jgi:hypothetical protein
MHHIHFVIVPADNAEDAAETVQTELSDWGTMNNWRHPVCAVSQDGKFHDLEDNGWFNNIDDVYEYVAKLITDDYRLSWKDIQCIAKKDNPSFLELYDIAKAAEHLAEKAMIKPEEFNLFKDEFFSGRYEYPGITNLQFDVCDGQQLFAVAFDIHT